MASVSIYTNKDFDVIVVLPPNEKALIIENYSQIRNYILNGRGTEKNMCRYDAEKDVLLLTGTNFVACCPFYSRVKEFIINRKDLIHSSHQIHLINVSKGRASAFTAEKNSGFLGMDPYLMRGFAGSAIAPAESPFPTIRTVPTGNVKKTNTDSTPHDEDYIQGPNPSDSFTRPPKRKVNES